ncbi:MAG: T9SS type A sorting domain-containing protein, partial [Bacteroidota bacterium]
TKNIFNATLIIYNALGQIVYSREHVCGADIVLRLPDVPDGIYQMRISEGNRVVVSDKLLIRRR